MSNLRKLAECITKCRPVVLEKVNKAAVRVKTKPENIAGVKLPVFEICNESGNEGVIVQTHHQLDSLTFSATYR